MINNLKNLKDEEFEVYSKSLPKILNFINNFAHEHNQIPIDEKIVVGFLENSNTVIIGRATISNDELSKLDKINQKVKYNLKPLIVGTPVSSIDANTLTNNIVLTVKEELEQPSIVESCSIEYKSDKRTKKNKNIKNWDKKHFWQNSK